MFLDISATVEGRQTMLVLSKALRKQSLSMTVGGGIRTTQDIEELLNAGTDKIYKHIRCKNPVLIEEGAKSLAVNP